MTLYCLICDSTAVLSKTTATTTVILIGTLENILNDTRAVQPDPAEEPPKNVLIQLINRISRGVARATSGYVTTLAFAQDVQK